MELIEKTIVVTGASSGIGAAAAELFSMEGANIVLGARRSPELEALTARIRSGNGRAVFLAGDVRTKDMQRRWLNWRSESLGASMARSITLAS